MRVSNSGMLRPRSPAAWTASKAPDLLELAAFPSQYSHFLTTGHGQKQIRSLLEPRRLQWPEAGHRSKVFCSESGGRILENEGQCGC